MLFGLEQCHGARPYVWVSYLHERELSTRSVIKTLQKVAISMSLEKSIGQQGLDKFSERS